MPKTISKLEEAVFIFKKAGGVLSMTEALEKGVHRSILYKLRDQGMLEVLGRGLYRLKDVELVYPDFITISKKIPQGVICLISALSFHELTLQIPSSIYVAIPNKLHKPPIGYPPTKYFWYSDKLLKTGAVEYKISGYPVKISDPEKTLVDCVKFRNKIGQDVTLEALKIYWQQKKTHLNKLFEYAKMFRVEKILKSIMEAITSR